MSVASTRAETASTFTMCVLCPAEVVTKYSNFVSFPIFLNGRRLNTLQVRCRVVVNETWQMVVTYSAFNQRNIYDLRMSVLT